MFLTLIGTNTNGLYFNDAGDDGYHEMLVVAGHRVLSWMLVS